MSLYPHDHPSCSAIWEIIINERLASLLLIGHGEIKVSSNRIDIATPAAIKRLWPSPLNDFVAHMLRDGRNMVGDPASARTGLSFEVIQRRLEDLLKCRLIMSSSFVGPWWLTPYKTAREATAHFDRLSKDIIRGRHTVEHEIDHLTVQLYTSYLLMHYCLSGLRNPQVKASKDRRFLQNQCLHGARQVLCKTRAIALCRAYSAGHEDYQELDCTFDFIAFQAFMLFLCLTMSVNAEKYGRGTVGVKDQDLVQWYRVYLLKSTEQVEGPQRRCRLGARGAIEALLQFSGVFLKGGLIAYRVDIEIPRLGTIVAMTVTHGTTRERYMIHPLQADQQSKPFAIHESWAKTSQTISPIDRKQEKSWIRSLGFPSK